MVRDNENFKQAATFHFMNCSSVKISHGPALSRLNRFLCHLKPMGVSITILKAVLHTALASWITISVMPLPLGFMLYFTNRELVYRCIHLLSAHTYMYSPWSLGTHFLHSFDFSVCHTADSCTILDH